MYATYTWGKRKLLSLLLVGLIARHSRHLIVAIFRTLEEEGKPISSREGGRKKSKNACWFIVARFFAVTTKCHKKSFLYQKGQNNFLSSCKKEKKGFFRDSE